MTFQSEWQSGNMFNDTTTPAGFFGGHTLEGGPHGGGGGRGGGRMNIDNMNRGYGNVTAPVPNEGSNVPIPGTQPAPTGGPLGSGSNEPTGAQTLGQPMYPWLMPWGGPFAAPMTGTEQSGLNNLDQLGGNNFGLNNAQSYITNLQNGNYLDVANNPYIGAIGQNADTQRGLQDQRMMQELQSRAAAGGNALSGALMQQEGDYQRGSNANFNQMMNQMYQNMYSQERGYQNQAPGMQEDLLRSQLGGIGAQMGFGAVPRDIANQEIQGQYHDFTRQGQALQDQSRYSDYLNLAQQGRGYPNQTQNQYGDSNATQLAQMLAQMFGQGGSGAGGWGDLINGIFGGSGGSTGNTSPEQQGPQPQTDGQPIGYDGASDYQKWLGQIGTASSAQPDYGAALTQREGQFKQQQQNAGKASGASKAMTILAMISAILGSGSKSNGKAKANGVSGGAGGGNSLGGLLGKAAKDLLTKKPDARNNPTTNWSDQPPMNRGNEIQIDANGNPVAHSPYGYDFPMGEGTDYNAHPEFYETNNLPTLPGQGQNDNSFADIYNSLGGIGGDYSFDNADNGMNIGNFDPGFDYSGGYQGTDGGVQF